MCSKMLQWNERVLSDQGLFSEENIVSYAPYVMLFVIK